MPGYTTIKSVIAVFLIILVAMYLGSIRSTPTFADETANNSFRNRWMYMQRNLAKEEDINRCIEIMRRGKNAGYNGMILADFKFGALSQQNSQYLKNLDRIKQESERLQFQIVPAVMPFGWSNALLVNDPNMAAGILVKDARFGVTNGVANAITEPPVTIPNNSFENSVGNRLNNWSQDGPGVVTFVDSNTSKSGKKSLRIENPGAVSDATARISVQLPVAPHSYYHISFWVKTENFDSTSSVKIIPYAGPNALNYNNVRIDKTMNWTQMHVVFNSLENNTIRLWLGCWNANTSGKLWFDDIRMEEAGLVNLLKRPGCPVTVRNSDGSVTYKAGSDYIDPVDPKIGLNDGGQHNIYHAPPGIVIPPGSRIKNGDVVLVSYYHPAVFYGSQVPCSLTEPKILDLVRYQSQRLNDLLSPPGFMMSHNEIRVMNRDASDQALGVDAGKLLAWNAQQCISILKVLKSDARFFIWSDMFDPYSNAKKNYYFVKGNLAGSVNGLSKDIIIVNWNYSARQQSLKFFSDLGYSQMISVNCDRGISSVKGWLKSAKSVPGIIGIMYTTWQDDYSKLEDFISTIDNHVAK
jgi:hypothetical protein